MNKAEVTDPIYVARYAAFVERHGDDPSLSPPSALIDDLTNLFSAMAALIQPEVTECLCEAAPEYPGYVRLSIKGVKVLAPYFLAVSIPVDHLLQDIVTLGDAVRVANSSILCLSGSAVFSRVLHAISDLDYCEYAPESNIGCLIDGKVQSTAPTFFVEGEVDETPFHRKDTSAGQPRFKGRPVRKSAKLNYVGQLKHGYRPVSNLTLVPPEGGTLYDNTWPFQEVVIAADKAVPGGLVLPKRLGAYLLWLDRKMNEHLSQKPFKALKRSLSLDRVMGLGFSDDILKTLNTDLVVEASIVQSLSEVIGMAKSVCGHGGDSLLGAAEAALGDIKRRNSDGQVEESADACRAMVRKISESFKETKSLAHELL